MCVIIHKPKGKVITEQVLDEAWKRNSDGAGFTIIDTTSQNRETTTIKGFMTYDSFLKVFTERGGFNEAFEVVVHFRIATKGKVNASNCHPFYCPKEDTVDTLLYHNGTVTGYGDEEISDSKDLFDTVISKIDVADYSKVLETYTTGNRFLVINDGDVIRLGIWHELEGLYYSNNRGHPVKAHTQKQNYDYLYEREYGYETFGKGKYKDAKKNAGKTTKKQAAKKPSVVGSDKAAINDESNKLKLLEGIGKREPDNCDDDYYYEGTDGYYYGHNQHYSAEDLAEKFDEEELNASSQVTSTDGEKLSFRELYLKQYPYMYYMPLFFTEDGITISEYDVQDYSGIVHDQFGDILDKYQTAVILYLKDYYTYAEADLDDYIVLFDDNDMVI